MKISGDNDDGKRGGLLILTADKHRWAPIKAMNFLTTDDTVAERLLEPHEGVLQRRPVVLGEYVAVLVRKLTSQLAPLPIRCRKPYDPLSVWRGIGKGSWKLLRTLGHKDRIVRSNACMVPKTIRDRIQNRLHVYDSSLTPCICCYADRAPPFF